MRQMGIRRKRGQADGRLGHRGQLLRYSRRKLIAHADDFGRTGRPRETRYAVFDALQRKWPTASLARRSLRRNIHWHHKSSWLFRGSFSLYRQGDPAAAHENAARVCCRPTCCGCVECFSRVMTPAESGGRHAEIRTVQCGQLKSLFASSDACACGRRFRST